MLKPDPYFEKRSDQDKYLEKGKYGSLFGKRSIPDAYLVRCQNRIRIWKIGQIQIRILKQVKSGSVFGKRSNPDPYFEKGQILYVFGKMSKPDPYTLEKKGQIWIRI